MKYKIMSLAIFSAIFIAGNLFASETAKIDEPAPNFTLKDSNGEEHSLSDFKGKFVVLEWINFDCPFVRKHYNSGNMQNLQKKYTGKEVVWLTICSSAEGKQGYFGNEEINEKITSHEASMSAYLVDETGEVGQIYSAKTTPHMYIINPEGVLVYAGGIDDKASTDLDDIKTATNYVAASLDVLLAGAQLEMKVSKPYGCSVKYKN
jgi:peroxiredoxin